MQEEGGADKELPILPWNSSLCSYKDRVALWDSAEHSRAGGVDTGPGPPPPVSCVLFATTGTSPPLDPGAGGNSSCRMDSLFHPETGAAQLSFPQCGVFVDKNMCLRMCPAPSSGPEFYSQHPCLAVHSHLQPQGSDTLFCPPGALPTCSIHSHTHIHTCKKNRM